MVHMDYSTYSPVGLWCLHHLPHSWICTDHSGILDHMDSPLMSVIPRLRSIQPMGRPHMQLPMGSLPMDILLELHPQQVYCQPVQYMVLLLMIQPLLQILPTRPLMQFSLHMTLSLLSYRQQSSYYGQQSNYEQ